MARLKYDLLVRQGLLPTFFKYYFLQLPSVNYFNKIKSVGMIVFCSNRTNILSKERLLW